MKVMLFGSTPSATQATLTPAPVIPSFRAVGWLGLSESVLVVDRPSGSSCGVVAEHAPGGTVGVSAGLLECDRAGLMAFAVVAGAALSGFGPWMTTSGMTSRTREFDFSRATSPFDTVAAKESTRLYGLMCVACTWRSSVISGRCALATMLARARAAGLPMRAAANCVFKITITCWLTFLDSCAASALVKGAFRAECATGAAFAAAVVTEVPATKASTEPAAATSCTFLDLTRTRRAPPLLCPGILASSSRGGQGGHRNEPTPGPAEQFISGREIGHTSREVSRRLVGSAPRDP